MRHVVRDAGLAQDIEVDSAGTGDWHVGEPPDSRTRATAQRRGVAMPGAARQFSSADFERFDYVLAMDRHNLKSLRRMAPDDVARAKIHLLRSFDPASPPDADVPDPYFGGADGFEHVFDVCEAACSALLVHLRSARGA